MVLKVLLRLVPSKLHAAMQTTAISAAISPYSIAVTPESSFVKSNKIAHMAISLLGKGDALDAIEGINGGLIRREFITCFAGLPIPARAKAPEVVAFDARARQAKSVGGLGQGSCG
jgi:hypothetical protein